ncbi:MAG: hypothetical protein LBP67_10270 [Bacteroidales bacterium]|jgi:chromosome segregation ATPase|nr:hypothetical protein [Bacteroidales bacterium]
MKKTLLFILSIIVLLGTTSCTKQKKQIEALQNRTDSLQTVVNAKNQQINDQQQDINEYIGLIIEIQKTIESIKEKSGQLTAQTMEQKGATTEAQKEQLKKDISDLYEMVENSRKQVNSLQGQLSKSKKEIQNLTALVSNLEEQLNARDKEIAELRALVEKQIGQINILEKTVTEKDVQIQTLEGQVNDHTITLNTAWYIISNKKDLREKGIVDNKGRVIKETNSNFTAIDVRTTTEIPVNSKRITILSAHPASSYELVSKDKVVEKIIITNPAAFWSVEKRLVIQIK